MQNRKVLPHREKGASETTSKKRDGSSPQQLEPYPGHSALGPPRTGPAVSLHGSIQSRHGGQARLRTPCCSSWPPPSPSAATKTAAQQFFKQFPESFAAVQTAAATRQHVACFFHAPRVTDATSTPRRFSCLEPHACHFGRAVSLAYRQVGGVATATALVTGPHLRCLGSSPFCASAFLRGPPACEWLNRLLRVQRHRKRRLLPHTTLWCSRR